MADAEQEFKETVVEHLADIWLDTTTVEEGEELLFAIASQLGSYEQEARELFKGLTARADTDEDGIVSKDEIKQAIMALDLGCLGRHPPTTERAGRRPPRLPPAPSPRAIRPVEEAPP
ncbi:hypothetical protein [Streptomyces sp. NPDC048659]|uniref:hypothetical protein n=1 Tax=Streptomyces sp. NPDC048659 TaxID=3155489 RepID=UPI00343D846B